MRAIATVSAATRRSVLVLSCATFSSMVAQRLCDAMLPELSREFEASLSSAAQTVSLFAVTYGLAQLIYGPLGDRLGKFRVVTFATLACSLGSVLCAFAPNLNVLIVARVLVALGAAAIIPLSLAWVGDSVPYERRQETLARLSLGSTLGIVAGQLLGGVFTDTLGWRWAFALMTLQFGLVGAVLFHDWRGQGFPGLTSNAAAPAATNTVAGLSFIQQVAQILRGGWTRRVLLVAFVEGAAGFGVLAIWASHLHLELGLSLSASGATVALFGLGGMLYMTVAKRLIPAWGERGLSCRGGVMAGTAAVVLAWAPVWWVALPACLVAGFGFFMFHNTMQTNATQMAPQARGTAVSSFAACLFLGQSVGVVLAAGLAGPLGSAVVITLAGAVMVGAGLFFAHQLQHRERLAVR